MPTPTKYAWTFKSRLRTGVLSWKSSHLACQRLKEAVAEIESVARRDPVTAADGVVRLFERIWPAFQHVDTSSGALGGAVYWAQLELIPIVVGAQADRKTRNKWLDRLLTAIQDDGVDYLSTTQDHWGALCASPETASKWADEFLGTIRAAWSHPSPGGYVRESSLCLSSLVAAGRLQDALDILAIERYPSWHLRKFAVDALVAAGRAEEALAFAEASRGLNQPDRAIDAACEQILLDAGRAEEAYDEYALTANESTTGLTTFRKLAKKYPSRDPQQILKDLAARSGDPGLWFAAAKDAGLLDLALDFAFAGRTDPRTLSRACRDFVDDDPKWSLKIGRLAIQRLLDGQGYEPTDADAIEAFRHFMVAAERLGVADAATLDVLSLATAAKLKRGAFADTFLRQCSADPNARPMAFQIPRTNKRRSRR